MATNLPAVLDESNIDNSDLETQVAFYRARIEKIEKFSKNVESVVKDVEEFVKTSPRFVEVAMECSELSAKISVLREQLYYENNPDASAPYKEEQDDHVDSSEEAEELSSRMKKRYSALKKKIGRLLHPDKTQSEFNKELYHTAMFLLENLEFDKLEELLRNLEISRSTKASKFSKLAARDTLRSTLDDLKLRYAALNSELLQKLNSNEGIIYNVASQYGIKSHPTFNTVLNIQTQVLVNLRQEHYSLQMKLHMLRDIRNTQQKFSHDDADFTV